MSKWRIAAVALGALFMFWTMLTSAMYDTRNAQRHECVAAGGRWVEPEIKPWNLVEGTCR